MKAPTVVCCVPKATIGTSLSPSWLPPVGDRQPQRMVNFSWSVVPASGIARRGVEELRDSSGPKALCCTGAVQLSQEHMLGQARDQRAWSPGL